MSEAQTTAVLESPPDEVLTPEKVKTLCDLETIRQAFNLMRSAGARAGGRSGRSLRITKRKLLAWLDGKK